jgi:hypothetical protein
MGPSGDPTMKTSQTSVEEIHGVGSAGSGQSAPGKKNSLSPVKMINIDAADNSTRKKRLSGSRHTGNAENPSSGFNSKRAKEKVDGDKNESPAVSKDLAVNNQHNVTSTPSMWKKKTPHSHKGRRALETGEGKDTNGSAAESEICSSDKDEGPDALLETREGEDAPRSAAENEICSSDEEEETEAHPKEGESENASGSAAESEICSSHKEEETRVLLDVGESEDASRSAADSEICSSDKEEGPDALLEAGESEDASRSAAESEICSSDKEEETDALLEAGKSDNAFGSAAESEVCSSDEEEEISAFLGCSPVLQPVRQVGTGTVD